MCDAYFLDYNDSILAEVKQALDAEYLRHASYSFPHAHCRLPAPDAAWTNKNRRFACYHHLARIVQERRRALGLPPTLEDEGKQLGWDKEGVLKNLINERWPDEPSQPTLKKQRRG